MSKPKKWTVPEFLIPLLDNIEEVHRLTEIHGMVAGTGPGRKTGVEVLNKSAIVLLVACWETYIEEAAEYAFDILLETADTHEAFPAKVRTISARALRTEEDERRIWDLAGDGWRDVLKKHKGKVLSRYTVPFNTPNSKNIDELFADLLGIQKITKSWSWPGASAEKNRRKLDRLIKLRGEIAHKVQTERSVKKSLVVNYTHFIKRLAGEVANNVGRHIVRRTGEDPWHEVAYVGHKK